MNASDYMLNRLAQERLRAHLKEAKNEALVRQARAPRGPGVTSGRVNLLDALKLTGLKLSKGLGGGRERPCPTC